MQKWGGQIEKIRPGDAVWTPPGEKHWHGAAPDSAMTHISIVENPNGKSADWMEKVSDEQYQQLLDQDDSLVHITGYRQPKAEWFDVIRSGEFDYHSIDIDAQTLSLDITDTTATLYGRGIFNATIIGMKTDWRLQFTMRYEKQNNQWIVMDARYTSF